VVTQFASDYAGQVIVVRVNADENEALLNAYAVPTTSGGHTYGLPQTAFFLNGKEIIDATGYQSEAELATILSEL
jgi:thioredoxin-like negative regulator of GroEL